MGATAGQGARAWASWPGTKGPLEESKADDGDEENSGKTKSLTDRTINL